MSVLRDSGAALHAALPGVEREPAFRLAPQELLARSGAAVTPEGRNEVEDPRSGLTAVVDLRDVDRCEARAAVDVVDRRHKSSGDMAMSVIG